MQRDSNIELLRLCSMFMIVVYHFNLHSLGHHSLFVDNELSLYGLIWNLIYTLTLTATNIFILISGYFGIKFKVINVSSLFIQCLVWGVVGHLLYCYFTESSITTSFLGRFMPFTHNNWWFIVSYLCLYFLSPILNKAISSFSKKEHLMSIIIFSFVTLYMGYCREKGEDTWGTSLSHFIYLYLIARYIKLYVSIEKIRRNRYRWLILFFIFSTITFCLVFINSIIPGLPACLRAYPYCSPWVILGAISLLLFFSTFTFQNNIINWFAKSSLAVYLFQDCIYWGVGVLYPTVGTLLLSYNLGYKYLLLFLLSIVFFFLIIIIDRFFYISIYKRVLFLFDVIWKSIKGYIMHLINYILKI